MNDYDKTITVNAGAQLQGRAYRGQAAYRRPPDPWQVDHRSSRAGR